MLRPISPSPPSAMTRRPPVGQRRRGLQVEVRLGDLRSSSQAAIAAGGEVGAQLRDLLGGRVDQRRPHRAGRQAELAAARP